VRHITYAPCRVSLYSADEKGNLAQTPFTPEKLRTLASLLREIDPKVKASENVERHALEQPSDSDLSSGTAENS
jgi:hypothetical protein